MVGAGENAGAVDHVIDTCRDARRHAVPVLHRDDRFNQALALSQKLDELFVDNIDLVAQFRDAGFLHC